MFDLAQDIASGGDLAQINAASDILRGVGGSVTELVREGRREALFKAIRASAAKHRLAFEVGEEVAPYLSAARTASASGFEVVVYGHTHLVKRVGLSAGNSTFPVYLNTGTSGRSDAYAGFHLGHGGQCAQGIDGIRGRSRKQFARPMAPGGSDLRENRGRQ